MYWLFRSGFRQPFLIKFEDRDIQLIGQFFHGLNHM